MKAVGLYKHLPIEDPESLFDLDIQQPKNPTGHDLLVAIKANQEYLSLLSRLWIGIPVSDHQDRFLKRI
jgi:hypothetical protein